jgi:hypothetical protein
MAKKEFGGSKYFTLGALWWFVIAGVMGVLHLIFPGLVETPLVVILAVVVALAGSFAIVYFARTK